MGELRVADTLEEMLFLFLVIPLSSWRAIDGYGVNGASFP